MEAADYYAWLTETAAHLRRGEIGSIDMPTLAEEVDDLGKRELCALESRLAVLMAHKLKWEHLVGKRSRSWSATIRLQQLSIAELLEDSPSLRPMADQQLASVYRRAVLLAVRDTGLDPDTFPAACPYTVEDLIA